MKKKRIIASHVVVRCRYHIMLLLACLFTGLSLQAQDSNRKLQVNFQNATLQEVSAGLEKLSGYAFSYTESNARDYGKRITLSLNNVTITQVLEQLFQGSPLSYLIKGNMIYLRPNPAYRRPGAKGTLKGRVVDFETTQPLVGATVQLSGTAYGVVTDERGFYRLENVPAGNYDMVISYIGYKRDVMSRIAVDDNKERSYDVKLQAGGSLKEVVVDAGPRKVRAVTHNTERQLLQEIRGATGVVSGISNEMIGKTADRNAAEVVKRISGVTVMDDRFIVVRGMNERYNLTYLNGSIAPATELYSKAFAYDLLPSSIIDRILVYKSPVADLSADYAGAGIKIFTKNAMPVRHLDVGVQIAHRPGSTLETINSYTGGKYDFLGFDDGTRKLPAFSPGYFNSGKTQTSVSQEEMVKGFSPELAYGTRKSSPDLQFFVNYYDAYRIGRKQLYNLTSVTYTKETRFYDVYRQLGNTGAFGGPSTDDGGQSFADRNSITNSRQTTEIGKVNVLENLTLKLNDNHQVSFNNFFVNEGRSLTSINDSRRNTGMENMQQYGLGRDIILSFQQRMLYAGNFTGRHLLGQRKTHEVNWNLSYTFDRQDIPDMRVMHFASRGLYLEDPAYGYFSVNTQFGGKMARLFIRNQEKVYNASIDYSWQLHPQFTLKAGTFQMYKVRQVGRRVFWINRGGLPSGESIVQPNSDFEQGWHTGWGHNDNNIIFYRQQDLPTLWNPANFREDKSGLQIYDLTNPVDAYTASEQNNAFYLMGDAKVLRNKLTLNAGVRVEYDRQHLSGAIEYNGIIASVPVDKRKTMVLPSFNATYRPDSLFVIRGGYGRTLNRPEFREITPYNDYDYQSSEYIQGNPKTVTATIDNYDLRFEFYPNNRAQNEVFNIGAFYKHLKDPIEKFRKDINNSDYAGFYSTEISFGNAISANIYGVEMEIKKSLSFIPGSLFRNLSVMLNGALIKSTTVERTQNEGFWDTTTVSGAPLQGQSPYVLNGGLFYENAGWGTKIGLVYNVSGPRIYAKGVVIAERFPDYAKRVRPDLLETPRHLLDLSVTQRIVKSLQAKFSIQNLLAQPVRLVEDYARNQRYDKEVQVENTAGKLVYTGDNIFSSYNPGRYFILSLSYAF
ncbi:TonB-dependent receptor [Chitinophaga nivalis]|uniref:TonB-dependent receptor n=1 Tax=Chitinophaga nivalis TaxID=2991709 RepID=A0ABT3IRM2_9BACT|nr:TonB-dependent receptor [Chitinophaga nivalis]MCW3463779.1 TonB-dependent receptor [Chitinophaga nivalis]MCW3486531.1 TonB-dependent receptor [Chitinophaga nivalis]